LCIIFFRQFVFVHSCDMACPPQPGGFYYVNYIWFILQTCCFSVAYLAPLSFLAYWNTFWKSFPFEDSLLSSFFVTVQESAAFLCHCITSVLHISIST
jgi:hypothetical protein